MKKREGKLDQDLRSIKIWFTAFATFLLLMRFLSDVVWCTFVLTCLGLREYSETVRGDKTSE